MFLVIFVYLNNLTKAGGSPAGSGTPNLCYLYKSTGTTDIVFLFKI